MLASLYDLMFSLKVLGYLPNGMLPCTVFLCVRRTNECCPSVKLLASLKSLPRYFCQQNSKIEPNYLSHACNLSLCYEILKLGCRRIPILFLTENITNVCFNTSPILIRWRPLNHLYILPPSELHLTPPHFHHNTLNQPWKLEFTQRLGSFSHMLVTAVIACQYLGRASHFHDNQS